MGTRGGRVTAQEPIFTRAQGPVARRRRHWRLAQPAGRKVPIARRATFARTAMSTIRSWVKHGHDLSTLFPAKVTKHAITLPTGQRRQRKPSAKRLVTAVQSQVKELIVTLLALSEVDKAKAISEEQTVIGQLSEQLIELGVVATRDAGVALAEGRPLKLGSGRGTQIFMPTASQVIRSQARPS